jgi:hypothetical protein
VHALRLDPAGTTVWLSAADTLTSPWQSLDGIRWRRPGAGAGSGSAGASEQAQAESASACLVRVGADPDDQPVFVDLSRLDGVLSVTGDPAVARDVVQNLLAEIARTRPNTPVTVLTSANSPARLTLPAGLAEITRVPLPETGDHHPRGTVRGGAARTPVRGLVVMAGSPTAREAAELVALCGSTGAGWTGLVAGAVDGGAHWRWHTDPDGRLEIPVLGLELTVPA